MGHLEVSHCFSLGFWRALLANLQTSGRAGSFCHSRHTDCRMLFSCRRRLGPHVCLSGFGSGCCPGWAPSMGGGHCTLRKYSSL